MNLIKNLSLKKKLLTVILFTTGCSLLLVSLGIMLQEKAHAQKDIVGELATMDDVIGSSSSAALRKAAFFVKLLPFVALSEDAKQDPSIAVVGNNPFKGKLKQALKIAYPNHNGGRLVHFVSLDRYLRSKATFDVVFVGLSDENEIRHAIEILSARGDLTIGDAERFCQLGGMVNLINSGNRIRFEINRAVAEQAGLKINSQLLAMATLVDSDPSPGGDQ